MLNTNKNKILQKYIYIFVPIVLSLIVHFRWISTNYFSAGDWRFFSSETLLTYLIPSILKYNHNNFGSPNTFLFRLPILFVQGIIASLGWDSNIVEKIVYLVPIILLPIICSFILIKHILKDNMIAMFGSLIFSFNTYFISSNAKGHGLITIAFAISTLAFLYFIKSLEEKSIRNSIISGILLFIAGSYDFRMTYIMIFILFFYFLYYHSYILRFKTTFRNFRKLIIYLIIPVFITILLNFYWIIGIYSTANPIADSALKRNLFGDQFWNMHSAFSLFHPFWNFNSLTWFKINLIPMQFWILPILAFITLLSNKKNKNILFFALLGVIGIFLTKQTDSPFGFIYRELFKYFPGFNAFREASKFYTVIALSYAILISYSIKNILKKFKTKWLKIIIFASFFLLLTYQTLPILTGTIGNLYISNSYPNDEQILRTHILNENAYFRTLWIPMISKWGYFSNKNQMLAGVQLVDNMKHRLNKTNYIYKSLTERAQEILHYKELINFCTVTSIKYIIVPKQLYGEYNLFQHYGSRDYYVEYLDNITRLNNSLMKININTSEIIVYENTNYLEPIYISEMKQNINQIKFDKIKKIFWEQMAPHKYNIKFKSENRFYLYFGDSYHPDWKIFQDFNWIKGFNQKHYIFDETHFEAYEFLNGWQIDPTKLTKGDDGYYELTLYFRPQSHMYVGLIISCITLISCIGYLIFDIIKSKRAKNAI